MMPDMTPEQAEALRKAETARLREMMEKAGWPEGAKVLFLEGEYGIYIIGSTGECDLWTDVGYVERDAVVAALACDWPKLADAHDVVLVRVKELEARVVAEAKRADEAEAQRDTDYLNRIITLGESVEETERAKARVAELEKQATGLCGTCAKYEGCEKRGGHYISFCVEFEQLMED